MSNLLKQDNFITGLVFGLLLPVPMYGVLWTIDTLMKKTGFWSGLHPHENLYLLSIALNFIAARFYLVKWKLPKTGKGMMLVSIVMVVAFFLLFYKQI